MTIQIRTADKFDIKMINKAKLRKFPYISTLELTYKCNHRCIHCYVVPHREKKEMTTEEVKRILDQLRKAGCFHVTFTGGEIFTRTDIFNILFYAKKKGFKIRLFTNGSMIDEKKADKIAELNPSLIEITMLGATPKTFDKISQVKGSFKRVMNASKLLKERGLRIQLKSSIIKPNFEDFLKIKRFSEKHGFGFRFYNALTPKRNGSKEPTLLRMDPAESQKLIKKAYPALFKTKTEEERRNWIETRRKSGQRKYRKLFKCLAVGKTIVAISPYGEMNLCLDFCYPEYSILKKGHSLEKGWKKIVDFVDSIKPNNEYKCAACVLRDFCSWCPARGLQESGDLNRCSLFEKRMAIVRAKDYGFWPEIKEQLEKQEGKPIEKIEAELRKQVLKCQS